MASPRTALVLAALAAFAALGAANVVFEETFDVHPERKPRKLEFEYYADDGFWGNELLPCPHRENIDNLHENCLRMTLDYCKNPNYPEKGGCFRNEIGLLDEKNIFSYFPDEYWVGVSFYMPNDYKPDPLKTLHVQVKANGGAFFSPGGPNFSLLDQYGMWAVGLRSSDECEEKCVIKDANMEYIGRVQPGKWVDFVYHTSFSFDPKRPGFAKLYMNGHLVWERTGIMTAYKDTEDYGMFIKWGVYKHQWGEGIQPTGYQTKHAEVIVNGFKVARGNPGEDKFDEVDTRPRCYNLQTCCLTCIDGKSNPLFNPDRCQNMCANKNPRDAAKQALCEPQQPCANMKQCCNMCKNGQHNPFYNADRCFSHCRATQEDREGTRKWEDNCFPLASSGCAAGIHKKHGLICSDTCEQHKFSFSCTCPAAYHISNKDGKTCIPDKKDKNAKDEDDEDDFADDGKDDDEDDDEEDDTEVVNLGRRRRRRRRNVSAGGSSTAARRRRRRRRRRDAQADDE